MFQLKFLHSAIIFHEETASQLHASEESWLTLQWSESAAAFVAHVN